VGGGGLGEALWAQRMVAAAGDGGAEEWGGSKHREEGWVVNSGEEAGGSIFMAAPICF
jgi:hypothetical protein